MPSAPDPSEITDDLEPELRTGPLGVPYVAPKGAPDLPGSGDGPDIVPDIGD